MNLIRSTRFATLPISCALLLFMSGIIRKPSLISAGETRANERDLERSKDALPTVTEARHRARLLHETIHATLHYVHHAYYRDDEGLPIPAETLKDVFRELSTRQGVELRWLAVNAQAMNVDHKPQNDFENAAVEALASEKDEFEQAVEGVYRHVGRITLGSECLKCHLPGRRSTIDRAAGLIIEIPVATR